MGFESRQKHLQSIILLCIRTIIIYILVRSEGYQLALNVQHNNIDTKYFCLKLVLHLGACCTEV